MKIKNNLQQNNQFLIVTNSTGFIALTFEIKFKLPFCLGYFMTLSSSRVRQRSIKGLELQDFFFI